MAKFKYLGPEMMVGRFGKLQTGAVVDLWISEAEYVAANDTINWEDVSQEDLTGVGTVVPAKVYDYDLTGVNWLIETRPALKRMSRSELGSVANAMRQIGCQIPEEPVVRTLSREHLFEVVYGEAKRLRWDQPGYQAVDRNARDSTTPIPDKPDSSATESEAAPETSEEETETTNETPAAETQAVEKRIIRKRR